jgi:anti-sigma factor RsiW
MRCAPFDLKDYFFGELPDQDRRTVEAHLAACSGCREELDALGFTRSALLTVREEEPPRRIAFVSDKVFEPSLWRRLWNSGAKLGFASAAMLSAAIVFHAVQARPVVANVPVASVQQIDRATIEAEVSKRVQATLEKVVTESESRQAAKLQQVVADQRRM